MVLQQESDHDRDHPGQPQRCAPLSARHGHHPQPTARRCAQRSELAVYYLRQPEANVAGARRKAVQALAALRGLDLSLSLEG